MDKIVTLLPTLALISHFVLVFLVLAIIFRRSWGRPVVEQLKNWALPLGFFTALVAVLGSLGYSEIIGFTPCVLCWYQRIFIYPQVIIFGLAWLKKDYNVGRYLMALSLVGAIIALYQSYIQFGGTSVLPCTAEGAECSRILVMAHGYITIPVMSLTILVYLLIFAKLVFLKSVEK